MLVKSIWISTKKKGEKKSVPVFPELFSLTGSLHQSLVSHMMRYKSVTVNNKKKKNLTERQHRLIKIQAR